MFDINGDKVLTFEEFTFATSADRFDDPAKKLSWLFDHVYDKVILYTMSIVQSSETILFLSNCRTGEGQ